MSDPAPRERRRRSDRLIQTPEVRLRFAERRVALAKEEDERSRIKKQNAMVKAVEDTRGLIVLACRKAEISERTHRHWMATDEKYATRIKEAIEIGKDMVEFRILQKIDEGDIQAMKLFAGARLKERGYGVHRNELVGANGAPISVATNSPTIEDLMTSTDPETLNSMVSRVKANAERRHRRTGG